MTPPNPTAEDDPISVERRRLRTLTPAGTRAVAAAVADWATPGDVVVLTGDLGAGKTTFTQGLALRLGVTAPVTSPTFTIMSHYEGARPGTDGGGLRVNHLDVYRLGSLAEAEELGLDELFDGDALTLIEWGEMIEPLLPAERLTVALELAPIDDAGSEADPGGPGDPADTRILTMTTRGHGAARRAELHRLLDEALRGHDEVSDERGDATPGKDTGRC
ncbi:MAG: tRNA (adenosine(37)-N6)-threonylcarbamoyltransferase complex ATPase subunit type 1 TsaE [Microthrixaceae bacterium]